MLRATCTWWSQTAQGSAVRLTTRRRNCPALCVRDEKLDPVCMCEWTRKLSYISYTEVVFVLSKSIILVSGETEYVC